MRDCNIQAGNRTGVGRWRRLDDGRVVQVLLGITRARTRVPGTPHLVLSVYIRGISVLLVEAQPDRKIFSLPRKLVRFSIGSPVSSLGRLSESNAKVNVCACVETASALREPLLSAAIDRRGEVTRIGPGETRQCPTYRARNSAPWRERRTGGSDGERKKAVDEEK